MRTEGTVKWFNSLRDMVSITADSATTVFVHYSAIQQDGLRVG